VSSAIATAVSAPTASSLYPRGAAPISVCAYSIPTAARPRRAGTGRASSPNSCAITVTPTRTASRWTRPAVGSPVRSSTRTDAWRGSLSTWEAALRRARLDRGRRPAARGDFSIDGKPALRGDRSRPHQDRRARPRTEDRAPSGVSEAHERPVRRDRVAERSADPHLGARRGLHAGLGLVELRGR